MSKYLPKEDLVFFSPLKKEEVLVRLADMLEFKKLTRITFFGLIRRSGLLYVGEIHDESFKITRNITSYQNSFQPEISGIVESMPTGSLIHVKMKLTPFVRVFMIVWMSLAGLAALICTMVLIKSPVFHPFLLIPLGMFLFGYLLSMGGFKFESWRTKQDLKQFFEATVE